jgi:hypothetical protein
MRELFAGAAPARSGPVEWLGQTFPSGEAHREHFEPLTLTAIRGLGIGTTQQACAMADHLVRQQLLDPLSETQFQAPDAFRQRFASTGEGQTIQVEGDARPASGLSRD